MDAEVLLEGLTPAQREAVTTAAAPLCVVAAAGSGKTGVLTRRIAHRVATGSAEARHVMAVTFTRKAAGELAGRLASLGVRGQTTTGTFHALALASLRRRWRDEGHREPTLLTRKARVLGPLVASTAPGLPVAAVAGEIEWAKARVIAPGDYASHAGADGRRPPVPLDEVAALYEAYEWQKRRRHLVDFDDLVLRCALALERDQGFAAAERWRHRHLFVDEVQDINPAQWRLLQAWLGDRVDLCVVGDPRQAVYAWNGADPSVLTRFADEPGTTVVRLDDNFRSSPGILAVAGAVAVADGGPVPRPRRAAAAPPTITRFESSADEADGIARAVRDRHAAGTPWCHLAVLARTNAQASELADALGVAGIPHRLTSNRSLLDHPAVVAVLAEHVGGGAPASALLADVDAAVADPVTPEEHRSVLRELRDLGRVHAAGEPGARVGSLLDWLSATTRQDGPDRRTDAVAVATFHAAKGLEWPVVFLAGLEEGLVPISHAATPGDEAEERRLLYVAITRAERELHCSWSAVRRFDGRDVTRRPSRWLAAMQAAVPAPGACAPPVDWRAQLADGRRRLRAVEGAHDGRPGAAGTDRDLLDALERWRARLARMSGVPVAAIVRDRALVEVAASRPTDHEGLAAVTALTPVVRSRYGDALLAVVADHVAS